MLTGSRSLALAGVGLAVLLAGAVLVLLARTGRSPSPGDRRTAGRHLDGTGSPAPSDTTTTRAGHQ
ncbi:hypothetical protein [Kitasatospora sp. NPDC088783]|uniref:hypothetical protein n=1 Tax=Kitasatospora sp. NPDC088783 TaxID=3364077 RepID=UPI00382C118B